MTLLNHSLVKPMFCLFTGMSLFFVIGFLSVPPFLHSKLAFGIVATLSIFTVCALFLKFDKASLIRYHLIPNRQTWFKLIQGLLVGTVIVGVMLALVFLLTDLTLTETASVSISSFLIASLAFIPFALMEELLFRGYPLFKLESVLNPRWSIVITSIGFALYHYNGTSSIVSLFLGPGVWGIVFCIAAIHSNSIAMPLGIHIAANFLQAVVGLKPDYHAIWISSEVSGSSSIGLSVESLGLALQLLLLVCAMLVVEVYIRRQKAAFARDINRTVNQ